MCLAIAKCLAIELYVIGFLRGPLYVSQLDYICECAACTCSSGIVHTDATHRLKIKIEL